MDKTERTTKLKEATALLKAIRTERSLCDGALRSLKEIQGTRASDSFRESAAQLAEHSSRLLALAHAMNGHAHDDQNQEPLPFREDA